MDKICYTPGSRVGPGGLNQTLAIKKIERFFLHIHISLVKKELLGYPKMHGEEKENTRWTGVGPGGINRTIFKNCQKYLGLICNIPSS